MGRAGPSKSNLFLLELIIVILFFSVCTAVCVSLFVQAWHTGRRGIALGDAVLLAQSAAECFKRERLDALHLQEGAACFDENLQPSAQAAVYRLTLEEVGGSDGVTRADICVYFEDSRIYSITAARFDGGGGG